MLVGVIEVDVVDVVVVEEDVVGVVVVEVDVDVVEVVECVVVIVLSCNYGSSNGCLSVYLIPRVAPITTYGPAFFGQLDIVARKPDFTAYKQQRSRSACAFVQSGQRRCS